MSVPIATYNMSRVLIDRAIASVQAQTYERWEAIVVGDGCTDDTADRVQALGDPRIRFVNLPFRSVYPDNSVDRWLVSGTMPYNRAVELCCGEWLAPLDDDDEFLPGHIEMLLELALERRAEFVYGALEQVTEIERRRTGAHWATRRWLPSDLAGAVWRQPAFLSFRVPPEYGSGHAGVTPPAVARLLRVRLRCWIVGEPVDWNVVRRMQIAGVIMAATEGGGPLPPFSGRRHR